MMFRPRLIVALLSATLSASFVAPIVAQSLADVARKEEERRKQLKEEAKVITNKDLSPVMAPAAQPPAKEGEKTDAKEPKDGKDKDAKDADATAKGDKDKGAIKDQAYWADGLKSLRGTLEKDQSFAEALQTRINVLTADFTARDNPIERDRIGRDRQRAISDLENLKKTIEADKKAIADFEESARRAGVPAGWLR